MSGRASRHTLGRMGREPEDGDAFVFDLVDDDLVDHPVADRGTTVAPAGPDGAPDVDAREGPAVPAGPPRWLRPLLPVAAVLAIVLGTGFALDGARDAERMDRIRGVSGGVLDVSTPLGELWTWDGDVGSRGSVDDWGTVQVAALGDLLAFVSDGELVALDPASGAEVWAIPLGVAPDCGPTGYPGWEEIATATLVCLQGADSEREVIAVGPEGVASAPRVLDPADTRRHGTARPGPSGTVLRADRAGADSAVDLGDAECTTSGECTGTVEDGPDIVVRAEDAVTGAELWSVTVPFTPTPAADCNPWQGAMWGGDGPSSPVGEENRLSLAAFGARIGPGLVDLYGCGVNDSITPDGELLDGVGAPGAGRVTGLSSGRYIASGFDAAGRTVLYSADGDVLRTIPGFAVEAHVVAGSGMLLGWDERVPGVHAYDPDGTRSWDGSPQLGNVQFAAEVGETAVVLDDGGVVRGLDAATGDERWTTDLSDGSDGPPSGDRFLIQAFTDGRHVLLVLHDDGGSFDLVSLDAASGELEWEETMADALSLRQNAALVPVGGHLLALTPVGVRGLG